MIDDLIIQADDTTPIFLQLENQIVRFIRAGRWASGAELPSVRAMASHLAINPMTVSKTVNRLVEAGWLVRRRGRPTCVSPTLPSLDVNMDKQLNAEVGRLVQHCRQLGMSRADLVKEITLVWDEEEHDDM